MLYGHSWGGMLAIEYALNYQQHLRGLVISNMTAGMQSYLKRTAALKRNCSLPKRWQGSMRWRRRRTTKILLTHESSWRICIRRWSVV